MLPKLTSATEDVFSRHYEWLLKWAMYMTRGQKEQSEDLVQELYIQFLRTAPGLGSDEDAKAYLYRSLRNLHLSQCARNARSLMRELPIYKYDSLHLGISNIDRSALLSVHEDLWQICCYVSERRTSLRAASYFILRFFLDYLPSEIMSMANISRASYDKAIQQVRAEVHGIFRQDGAVIPISRTATSSPLPAISQRGDVTEQINRHIHETMPGECFTRDDVARMYASASPVETQSIAHLSACLKCRLLCLQHLGEDEGPGKSATVSKKLFPIQRAKRNRLARLERSYRENFEHRPAYLHLVLAGRTEASQHISSPRSELTASVPFTGDVAFVEITSEQGVRLMCLPVEGNMNQSASDTVILSELSDGRSLTATASLIADSLFVSATYTDPVVETAVGYSLDELISVPSKLPSASLFTRVRESISRAYWPWLVASVVACGLLVAFLLPSKTTQRDQALHLLLQNQQAETALLADHDLRRTGTFHIDGPSGLVSEGGIEVWETSSPSRKMVSLIGPDGKSGEAVNVAGLSTLAPEQMWRVGFDTGTVEDILRTGSVSVGTLASGVVTINAHGNAGSTGGWTGSVILDQNANHVVEQSIELHLVQKVYRVRIVEASYEVHSKGTYRPNEVLQGPDITAAHVFGNLPSAEEIVREHIDALWGIQHAGLRSDEQLTVARNKHGVTVAGVVQDSARKKALSDALLRDCRVCTVSLQPADAHQRTRRSVPTTVQVEELSFAPSPAEQMLASSRTSAKDVEAHRLSIARMDELSHLSSALASALGALEATATCCSQAELSASSTEEQQRWAMLVAEHTREADRQIAPIQSKIEEFSNIAGVPSLQAPEAAPDGLTGPDRIRLLHRKAIQLQLEVQRFAAASKGENADPTELWRSIQLLAFEIHQQLISSPITSHNTH